MTRKKPPRVLRSFWFRVDILFSHQYKIKSRAEIRNKRKPCHFIHKSPVPSLDISSYVEAIFMWVFVRVESYSYDSYSCLCLVPGLFCACCCCFFFAANALSSSHWSWWITPDRQHAPPVCCVVTIKAGPKICVLRHSSMYQPYQLKS